MGVGPVSVATERRFSRRACHCLPLLVSINNPHRATTTPLQITMTITITITVTIMITITMTLEHTPWCQVDSSSSSSSK